MPAVPPTLAVQNPQRHPSSMSGPVFVLSVESPTLYPVASKAGQLWVVRPAEAVHTITVVSHCGSRFIRSASVPPGILYGAVLNLVLDGVVAFLTPQDALAWRVA
ncbi:hypothetical protein [Caudoviricetes sp.]|nr:hypothetical protein [Caudoviricetes sp.]